MINSRNIIFDYPGVRALNDVSFSVSKGAIVALVGPNGAGKTTLLSCLAGLEIPFSGSITIDGIDVLENPRACHRRVGYLADFFGLYQDLTVEQCLRYACRIHEVNSRDEDATVKRAAMRLGIDDRMHMRAGALSRGLRQRLAIAQSIVHEPGLLLLDEPASGLDPEARHELSRLFIELQQQGMTLLVSSHILAELEEYCTDMLILRDGMMVESEHITSRQKDLVSMRLQLLNGSADIQQVFANIEGIEAVEVQGQVITFRCTPDQTAQHEILKQLINNGAEVYAYGEERVNMQDAYLATLKNRESP